MGKGTIYAKSSKQKLNTKSSTEAEVVSVDDCLPQILWTNYFLEEQGYKSTDTIVYQDNKSAMLLEKNGKWSSSKRTKHMNVRYFFVKDKIKTGDIKLEYCGTNNMIADYFTKPLQGQQFTNFRKQIMNLSETKCQKNLHWF